MGSRLLTPDSIRHLRCGDPTCTQDHGTAPIFCQCNTCGPRKQRLRLAYHPEPGELVLDCDRCGKGVARFAFAPSSSNVSAAAVKPCSCPGGGHPPPRLDCTVCGGVLGVELDSPAAEA